MLKVLAGDLSATFNLDGGHLSRYVQGRAAVIRSLCDQLLLHDQILVPTQDYLTAAGMVCLLGERNVISLLDADRLRFVRLQGVFAYARGTGPDGALLTFEDPQHKRPTDAPIEDSVRAALATITGRCSDVGRLSRLLIERSQGLMTKDIVGAVLKDAYADLKQTTLWDNSYRYPNPDLLALPGMNAMQVRVLGPDTDVSHNVVDALLALALMNMELYLSESMGCVSTSTGSPIGDCIALKLPRLDRDHPARSHLWSFMDVAGVPDLSKVLLADEQQMAEFLKLTHSADAQQFRVWFHSNANLSEREILKAYVDLLYRVPSVDRAPAKALRFAITTAVDALPVPLLGAAASFIDDFVVSKLLSGRSPKFFVETLRSFAGRLKPH